MEDKLEPWVIQQLIREQAYYLWYHDNCPDGDVSLHYWLLAKQQVLKQYNFSEEGI